MVFAGIAAEGRRTGSPPARKSDSPGAQKGGEIEGNGRGGRGIFIGSTMASFKCPNRPESQREKSGQNSRGQQAGGRRC